MRGVFTREERAVVLFLTLSLLIGSAVVQARRVFPESVPDFGEVSVRTEQQAAGVEPPAGPVDINAGSIEDLMRLPGVGPVRAGEIVRLRELRGGFASLDELLDVKGIGPVTLDGLRDHAIVSAILESEADSCGTAAGPGP